MSKSPLSLHRKKWSKKENENLRKGIRQQFQEMMLQLSVDRFRYVQMYLFVIRYPSKLVRKYRPWQCMLVFQLLICNLPFSIYQRQLTKYLIAFKPISQREAHWTFLNFNHLQPVQNSSLSSPVYLKWYCIFDKNYDSPQVFVFCINSRDKTDNFCLIKR